MALSANPDPGIWGAKGKVYSLTHANNVVYAGVDFSVERGERLALVGDNGAGKSTLLKMLAGVLDFDRGERTLGSHVAVQPLQELPKRSPPRRQHVRLEDLLRRGDDAEPHRQHGGDLVRRFEDASVREQALPCRLHVHRRRVAHQRGHAVDRDGPDDSSVDPD